MFGLFIVFYQGSFGCSKRSQLQQDLLDYQHRLANVLKLPAPASGTITSLSYPANKALQIPVTSLHIKLFELYALSGCDVAAKIAQRNTQLGRTQYPSSRYLYEVDLINSMQACLAGEKDPVNKQNLENWISIKTRNLPLVWADLIQSSEEIRRAMGANQGFIQGNEQDGLGETRAALQYLINLHQHPKAQPQILEEHLKMLGSYQLPARLWRSELLITAVLAQTNHWLRKNKILTLCANGKSSEQIEYLNNVFRLFFIERIQVFSSRIVQYHYQLSPLLEQLADQPDLNPAFTALLAQHQSNTYKQFTYALQDHIVLCFAGSHRLVAGAIPKMQLEPRSLTL